MSLLKSASYFTGVRLNLLSEKTPPWQSKSAGILAFKSLCKKRAAKDL